MRLTEKYYIMDPFGLVEVKGKRYNDDFAITYNHLKNVYNITHISTGSGLSHGGFKKLKDCLANADNLIASANSYMNENLKLIQKYIWRYNRYLKNGDVVKLETVV